MNALIVTQARFGSTRFPGKVLKNIGTKTLLQIHLERLRKSSVASAVLVATTQEKEAQKIAEISKDLGCGVFQGSVDNVLDRFYQAVERASPDVDVIVRVTSDCPLNDASLIDQMLRHFESGSFDYLSNVHPPTYPDGLDIEIFTRKALKKAWNEAKDPKDLEHVTHYFYSHPELFHLGNFRGEADLSALRLTVDTPDDLTLIQHLIEDLGDERPWTEYVAHLKSHPNLITLNQKNLRNEGF